MSFSRVASVGHASRHNGVTLAISVRARLAALSLPILLLSLALLSGGCSLESELEPNPIAITVRPVPKRVQLPGGDSEERRRLVDGFATDPEWRDIPYTHIAVGPEYGNQGGSFLASVKVVHDSTRIYFLVEWPDQTPNRLGPRLIWQLGNFPLPDDCDSLAIDRAWRLTSDDEDRLSIMWDMGDARDSRGTFREVGCAVACHGNMHPTSGSVDIWQWRAARTNPLQFPLTSSRRVGFADDGYADGGGRINDPGRSFYRENYRLIPDITGELVPAPLGLPAADFTTNDRMRPCEYVYEPRAVDFSCNTRDNPCRVVEQEQVTEWVQGDDLSAFLLYRPLDEVSRESRHDVEARGRFNLFISGGGFRKGTWTLEMSRLLRVGRSEDLDFDLNRAEPYHMAIAIMDNTGRIHSGSTVIEIRFQP